MLSFDFECFVRVNTRVKERKCYDKGNYDEIRTNLEAIDWENEFRTRDVNSTWKVFTSIIDEQIRRYIPVKRIKSGPNSKREFPLDKEVLEVLKKKKHLSRKALSSGDQSTRREYNKVRNRAKKLIRKARKDYEHSMAKKAKENPKVIWRYINSKSKTRVGIGELCKNPKDPKSVKTNDDREKANILAKFFTSVFTVEPEGEIPVLEDRHCAYSMEDIVATEEEIEKLLKKLRPDKSPGLDGLHPRFLRELATVLAKPLCMIFNQSLKENTVPEEWKKAQVSAIFKKGEKSLAGNYRPVSLTSIACKVMETIVRNRLVDHMKINKLFTVKQYGFMSGRSTALQLLSVLDKWTAAMECGNPVDCIYMDFQKAFDTVPHKRLVSKLTAYGIKESTIIWIKSFLDNRLQHVNINNKKSDWMQVTSGIPQGSVLGPILFVIYINDLPDLVKSDVYLFADDTKIFKIMENSGDSNILQRDLDILTQWSDKWLLKFHPDKCKHMHINRKGDATDVRYRLLNTELQTCKDEKDIGVIIDSELSFDKHISEKVKKANSMFAILRRSFHFLDAKTFIPLYKTLVRTHLDYASSVYHPFKMKHIEQLESVQRRATKQLPNMQNLTYPERLQALKLPTLSYRRIRGDMIEMYKIMSGLYDNQAVDFIQKWSDTAQRSSVRTHDRKIFPIRAKTAIRRNAFAVRSANIWNSLPIHVVNAKTINTFKNRLDAYWQDQDIMYNDFKADIKTTTGSHKHGMKFWESSGEDPCGT